MIKKIKILEVFAHIDDKNPSKVFGWAFFGDLEKKHTHEIIGMLEHIKSRLLIQLNNGTFNGDTKQ